MMNKKEEKTTHSCVCVGVIWLASAAEAPDKHACLTALDWDTAIVEPIVSHDHRLRTLLIAPITEHEHMLSSDGHKISAKA